MKELVDNTMNDYNDNKLDDKVCDIECNLDCTQFSLLNGECNSSNFICDVIRVSCKCDCVILSATSFLCDEQDDIMDIKTNYNDNDNDKGFDDSMFSGFSGSASNFNIDGYINKGAITYRDIVSKLYTDKSPIIILELYGHKIRNAIEHGLSKNEDMNGNELLYGTNKFPHVSGLRFVYDPIQQNGMKIKTIWIMKYDQNYNIHDDDEDEKFVELQDDEIYSVAISGYLANGGDGYDVFKVKHTIFEI